MFPRLTARASRWHLPALRIVFIGGILACTITQAEKPTDPTALKSSHVSLPAGPGSLEGLGSTFRPSLNTGGASYSVPITVMPGRAGFAPTLT